MFLAQVLTDPGITAPGTSYDFTPMLQQVIMGVGGLLVTVLTALAAFGISWLRSKTALIDAQAADTAQQFFSEKIAHMMAYAESVAKDSIPYGGVVTTDNPFLGAAAEFGLKMYPDTIGKLDYEAIAKAIISRLPSGPMAAKAEAITVAKAGVAPAVPVIVEAT